MMGDNRDNSSDSRLPADQGGVGYVPFENLIGRARVIFFSIDEDTPAWEVWRWPWDGALEPHLPAGALSGSAKQAPDGWARSAHSRPRLQIAAEQRPTIGAARRVPGAAVTLDRFVHEQTREGGICPISRRGSATASAIRSSLGSR